MHPQNGLMLVDISRVNPLNDGAKTMDENRSFQSQAALRTLKEIQEKEDWGKSMNGYIGGGNFD